MSFRQLHQPGNPFVLANARDIGSAHVPAAGPITKHGDAEFAATGMARDWRGFRLGAGHAPCAGGQGTGHFRGRFYRAANRFSRIRNRRAAGKGSGVLRAVLYALVLVIWTLPGAAQDLPEWQSIYVNDFAEILSPETEAQLEDMLKAARADRDHEMTVVTIDTVSRYAENHTIERFGKDLFNHWGVGNAERNDGILMLVAVEDRKVRIALGSGFRARFDGVATRIIDSVILPDFRAGQMEQGILEGTAASLERLRLDAPLPDPTLRERFDAFKSRSPLGAFLATIGAVLALPATALLGLFGMRLGQRKLPRKCPECGRRMFVLGNVQEKQHLEPGQIVEERIGSKDYCVWVCTHDGHVTVKAFPRLFSKKSACVNCSYHTSEATRTVTIPATYQAAGEARMDHSCANCGHEREEYVMISRKIRNSSSSGFGGGSGGGGGGFGGGSSSGGGGSGSW